MKYNISFKNGSNPLRDLSQSEVIKFKIENLDKLDTFVITEIQEEEKMARTPKSDFLKTISDTQRSEIQRGEKIVKFSEEIGWYLQIVKDSEGIPTDKLIKNNNLKASISQALDFYYNEIWNEVKSSMPDCNENDFKKLLYNGTK